MSLFGPCTYCHTPAQPFAQFPFGYAYACDPCTAAHGGWREGDARPVCFPRASEAEAPPAPARKR